MRINRSLAHLPESKRQEINIILKILARFPEVETAILYGSYATVDWVDTEFTEEEMERKYGKRFNLLIIYETEDKARSREYTSALGDKLNFARINTGLSFNIHGIDFVNEQINLGSYFFNDIREQGIVLYSSGRFNLAIPKGRPSLTQIKANVERDFCNWQSKAGDFLFNAAFFRDRRSYQESAFLLFEATELYYTATILVFTGYKAKTRNLEILRKIAETIDKRFREAFYTNDEIETYYFDVLNRANVNGHPNSDLIISAEILSYLIEKIFFLRKLTANICYEKMLGSEDENKE